MTIGWSGSFGELIRGESDDPDRFRSPSAHYPWGRVYGGQVVAQALWAAGQTVAEQYVPHSLHAYFIRGGLSDRPIDLEVERTRDGRSFMTRHVLGRQDGKVMLEMTASFHIPEPHEAAMVTATMAEDPPGTPEPCPWSDFFERAPVPRAIGTAAMWARFVEEVEATPLMRACALAFVSDDVPTEAVMNLHPTLRFLDWENDPENSRQQFMSASLDHAIWFHRIPDPQQWQLHTFHSDVVENGRGLSQGKVFDAEGQLQATVVQEVVIRHTPRPETL